MPRYLSQPSPSTAIYLGHRITGGTVFLSVLDFLLPVMTCITPTGQRNHFFRFFNNSGKKLQRGLNTIPVKRNI